MGAALATATMGLALCAVQAETSTTTSPSRPARALELGARVTGGAAATDADFEASVAAVVAAAFVMQRFEAGLELGAVGFTESDASSNARGELWGLGGLRVGGTLGYRAPVGARATMPLRARAGALIPTSAVDAAEGVPDGVFYLGASWGIAVPVSPVFSVEITPIEFDSYFWRNSVDGMEAALSLRAGVGGTFAFGL